MHNSYLNQLQSDEIVAGLRKRANLKRLRNEGKRARQQNRTDGGSLTRPLRLRGHRRPLKPLTTWLGGGGIHG